MIPHPTATSPRAILAHDRHHHVTVEFADGTTRRTPTALSQGQGYLNLPECLAGRLPWHEDAEAAGAVMRCFARVTDTLSPHNEAYADRDPRLHLLQWLNIDMDDASATAHHARNRATRDLIRARCAEVQDAVTQLTWAGGEITRLREDPLAAALRASSLWPMLLDAFERTKRHVAGSAIWLSCDIVQVRQTIDAATGVLSITIDFIEDTPANWPDAMADRWMASPGMQARYLDMLDAADPSLPPIGPARGAGLDAAGMAYFAA